MKKNNVYTVQDFVIDFQKYLNPDWATLSTALRNVSSVSNVFVCDQYLAYVKGCRDGYMHDFTLARLSEIERDGKQLLSL